MNKNVFILLIVFLFDYSFSQSVWTELSNHPDGSGVTGIVVASNGDIIATTGSYNFLSSDTGGVSRSTDGGETWEKIFPAYIARTVEIDSNGNLFASIWNWPTTNEGIYKSTDNGATWNPVHILGSSDNVFSIKAHHNGILYAGTRRGVLVSFNNGESWNSIAGFPTGETWVVDVEVDANDNIYAASYSGFYISTNGGLNWELAQGIEPGDTVTSVGILHSSETDKLKINNVVAGTTNEKLYKSSGGFSFDVLLTIAVITYVCILMSNNFAITGTRHKYRSLGDEGGVIISTDNWSTWNFDNDGLPANASTGCIAIDMNSLRGGTVFYLGLFEGTINGAKIFKKEYNVTSVKSIDLNIPDEFSLEQNYPNPFNPATTIRFNITQAAFTSLEVYNLLGEKISTLVSKDLKAGVYEYEWNASNLSSGVYFYKLASGTLSVTKKLLLAK